MVPGIVAVVAALEERAELHGLVRLVVVHRPRVEPRDPQPEPHREREGDERAEAGARHLGRP